MAQYSLVYLRVWVSVRDIGSVGVSFRVRVRGRVRVRVKVRLLRGI